MVDAKSLLGDQPMKPVLVGAGALLVLVGGAVAGMQLGLVGGGGGGVSDAVEQVPDGVDSVTRLDGAVLTNDDVDDFYRGVYDASGVGETETETETEAYPYGPKPSSPDVPPNLTAFNEEIENRTGLDPRGLEEVVVFTKRQTNYSTPRYRGTIVHGNWNESAFVDAFRNASTVEYRNVTINGTTVYRPPEDDSQYFYTGSESWLAILDDGEYVTGSEAAVRDVIGVANGSQPAIDGPLRSAYEKSHAGFLRSAQRSPNANLTALNESYDGSGLNLTVYGEEYNSIHVSTTSLYTTGNGFGMETRLETNTTSAAKDVADVYEGLLKLHSGAIQNETIEEQLRSVSVDRSGTTVTASKEMSMDVTLDIVRWYASIADSRSTSPPAYFGGSRFYNMAVAA